MPPTTDNVKLAADQVEQAVGQVLRGKPEQIRLAVATLLAEGHVLVEDVPGVGKTFLAKALARAVDGTVRRIQFTPDLMPSDITGVSVFNHRSREFEFQPGGVFANVVISDEINRAPPKTQSALLECMEEHQVSADGTTHHLDDPFMVVATQNPIDMHGTYPLPESQRDRFMIQLTMGYPEPADELRMVDVHSAIFDLDDIEPVIDTAYVRKLVELVHDVHVLDETKQYVVDMVNALRTTESVRLGPSPRATLHLIRLGRAWAAMDGRDSVLVNDIAHLAPTVIAHRLVLTDNDAPQTLVRKFVGGS